MPTVNYPQLPKGVWRGVWSILRKTPSRKLDEMALSAELGVQPTAAKAYAREFMKLGILDEEYRPTVLANRWRQDGEDAEIIKQILDSSYPEDLRDLAPVGDIDRGKIIRWFMNGGLGEGSAKNRAATYIMLSEGIGEDASIPTRPTQRNNAPKQNDEKGAGRVASRAKPAAASPEAQGGFTPELAVNVQIHISADATSDQIEAIFASMKRHFSR